MRSRKIYWLMVIALVAAWGAGTGKAQAAGSLTDIQGHWAQAQIQNMSEQNVVSGLSDGSFRPDQNITRAEFVAMVNRAFNFIAAVPGNFQDVESSHWFAADMERALAAGYLSGYPDGTARPNAQITRQEMAVILSDILGIEGVDPAVLDQFNDAQDIPEWSVAASAAMVKNNYLRGYPDGTFQATSPCSRAMAAYVLYEVLHKDFSRPTLSNAKVGDVEPMVTGPAHAPTLTFSVDSSQHYVTGSADLSTAVEYRVIKDNLLMLEGTASQEDDLIASALGFLDGLVGKPNDGIMGSNLIKYSPATIVLRDGGPATTYTIQFVGS